MAAAGNPLSSAVTSMEPPPTASGTAKKPLDFSADSVPQRIVLSPDQRSYCLEALKDFKEKRFHSPDKIASEFSTLQVSFFLLFCSFRRLKNLCGYILMFSWMLTVMFLQK